MGPHAEDLAGSQSRLLAGNHVNGDNDRDHHGRDDGGDNNVAGALGKLFAAGSAVVFFLVKKAHRPLILAPKGEQRLWKTIAPAVLTSIGGVAYCVVLI